MVAFAGFCRVSSEAPASWGFLGLAWSGGSNKALAWGTLMRAGACSLTCDSWVTADLERSPAVALWRLSRVCWGQYQMPVTTYRWPLGLNNPLASQNYAGVYGVSQLIAARCVYSKRSCRPPCGHGSSTNPPAGIEFFFGSFWTFDSR